MDTRGLMAALSTCGRVWPPEWLPALLTAQGPGKGRRASAALHSSDKSLEERFKGLRFIPLLTVGDDLLLLELSAESSNAPAIVTMKRSLISAMDFSWPASAGKGRAAGASNQPSD